MLTNDDFLGLMTEALRPYAYVGMLDDCVGVPRFVTLMSVTS